MPEGRTLSADTELVKVSTGATKPISVTVFMTRVRNRLFHDPKACENPLVKRSEIWTLLVKLNCSMNREPCYDQNVAEKIRNWLTDNMPPTGFDLTADFEALLTSTEKAAEEARLRRAAEEERKKAEKREKNEWDIVEDGDASDHWEFV